MVRGYGHGQVMVRCGGGVSTHKQGDGALRWRCGVVDGGRYVRRRVSEFIGTYQNLSEEIGLVRLSPDVLR